MMQMLNVESQLNSRKKKTKNCDGLLFMNSQTKRVWKQNVEEEIWIQLNRKTLKKKKNLQTEDKKLKKKKLT